MTDDRVLDPLYPRGYEYVCTRCDRAVGPPEERSVHRLHVFPTIEAGERLRNADRYLTLCPTCQRRFDRHCERIRWRETPPGGDRTATPPVCGRCGAEGEASDSLVTSDGSAIGPRRWSARFCPACSAWFDEIVTELVGEHDPYDGDWCRPPEFSRAEAAIADHEETDAGRVRANFERLNVGDLVRLGAYRRGYRRRGVYLGVNAWVECVLDPLRDGPPRQVELRTSEHHLSYPSDRTRDRWTLQTNATDRPTVAFAGSEIELLELSILYRSTE